MKDFHQWLENINRRGFLKSAAAAGAGAMLPSMAFGGEEPQKYDRVRILKDAANILLKSGAVGEEEKPFEHLQQGIEKALRDSKTTIEYKENESLIMKVFDSFVKANNANLINQMYSILDPKNRFPSEDKINLIKRIARNIR